MKTVKRTAQVGEEILITRQMITFEYYKKGDILKVVKTEGAIPELPNYQLQYGEVYAEGIMIYIGPDEYEVIIEEDNHAETNEA
jgi:hypothetical protein